MEFYTFKDKYKKLDKIPVNFKKIYVNATFTCTPSCNRIETASEKINANSINRNLTQLLTKYRKKATIIPSHNANGVVGTGVATPHSATEVTQ